jgi:glycosyltransferase involved in cell wall biosynthesis
MNTKLVMTLLVRDEEDILESNIRFHLAHGVDFIVVVDNGSLDRTPLILEKYQQKGVLSYEFIPSETFNQSQMVAYMAKRAVEEFGATHIIHCDADEFWLPVSGSLKNHLPGQNELFKVTMVNYIPPIEPNLKEFNFDTFTHIVPSHRHMPYETKYEQKTPCDIYAAWEYKVILPSTVTQVMDGNHDVEGQEEIKRTYINSVFVHHFPIRSLAQFKMKASSGVRSGEDLQREPMMGWHRRGFKRAYENGTIKREYLRLSFAFNREFAEFNGCLRKSPVPARIAYSTELYQLHELKTYILRGVTKLFSLISSFISQGIEKIPFPQNASTV